jgi:hypothetical protein
VNTPQPGPSWTEQQVREIIEIFPEGSTFAVKGGLDSEQQAHDVLALLKCAAWQIHQEYPHLSFSNLRQIIFTADYTGELAALGQLHGKVISPTMEPTGQSVAMTNYFTEGCVVVADSGLARMMLSEDEKARFFALQTMAHEFCHVSDETFKAKLFGETWKHSTAGLGLVYYPAVSALWSEYFAMRYSGILLLDPKLFTEHLAQVIQSTFIDIKAVMHTYLTDRDHVKAAAYFREKLRFLCQCMGYAIGALRGTGMTLEECDPKSATAIGNSLLAQHWSPLLMELDGLDASYGEWKDVTALDPLLKRIQGIAASYGFKWSVMSNGGLWVDLSYANYIDSEP